MKQCALHPVHLQLNAKMADFQGWQMPLQYAGTAEEHLAVRTAAGLFDVSHLGRIEISGPGAANLLQKTFTRNVSKLSEGVAAYGLFCNESGFILDDALLFHLPKGQSGDRYLITTNAVNTDKILSWLKKLAGQDVQINDRTQTMAQIALQGPSSDALFDKIAGHHVKKIKLKNMRELPLAGTSVMVSRTGYTGEHGYEFFVPVDLAGALWALIMESGKEGGLAPCGLAAREVLRLEMGYVMYGYDIDETRNPIEAGLGAFVDLNKEFIGKEAIQAQKTVGVTRRLAGFVLLEKEIPRNGASIFSENRDIGTVTSSAYSPSVRKGIGLGYVLTRYAQPGQEVEIEVRDREIAAKIAELPFYRKK
jgi:aminomethyltransferase